MQMAQCTFDMHMQDIVGTVIVGATLVMLHLEGNMDLTYLVNTLVHKKITYMSSVPSYLTALCHYLEKHVTSPFYNKLRSLVSGGESIEVNTLWKILLSVLYF